MCSSEVWPLCSATEQIEQYLFLLQGTATSCFWAPQKTTNSTLSVVQMLVRALGPPTVSYNTDIGNSLVVVVLSNGHFLLPFTSNNHFMEVINCLFMASPRNHSVFWNSCFDIPGVPIVVSTFSNLALPPPVDICPRTAAKLMCHLLQPVEVLD